MDCKAIDGNNNNNNNNNNNKGIRQIFLVLNKLSTIHQNMYGGGRSKCIRLRHFDLGNGGEWLVSSPALFIPRRKSPRHLLP
jgi:hypothetical protein